MLFIKELREKGENEVNFSPKLQQIIGRNGKFLKI
jgi:hypothetical protein